MVVKLYHKKWPQSFDYDHFSFGTFCTAPFTFFFLPAIRDNAVF